MSSGDTSTRQPIQSNPLLLGKEQVLKFACLGDKRDAINQYCRRFLTIKNQNLYRRFGETFWIKEISEFKSSLSFDMLFLGSCAFVVALWYFGSDTLLVAHW